MEIIKEAFDEGRTTDTEWQKSRAKKNQLKLDVTMENFSVMKQRDFYAPMPLHQICPETGEVLNTFPTRLAAARHIVKNVLKRPKKNPLAITGNMEICMRGGWKAYGFYWKLATPKTMETYAKSPANSRKVFVLHRNSGGVFPSIQSAADTFNVSTDVIRNRLKPNAKVRKKHLFAQEYNPTPRTLTFNSILAAAQYANVSAVRMTKWIRSGAVINNTTYTSNTKFKVSPRNVYVLYKNGRKLGEFNTVTDIAARVGIHLDTAMKKIKKKELMGEFNQYRVRVLRK